MKKVDKVNKVIKAIKKSEAEVKLKKGGMPKPKKKC